MDVPNRKGLVAVTGCDSGIGFALTNLLLDRGWSVVAGCFSEPPFAPHAHLVCWRLDLRDETGIARFAELVEGLTAHGQRLACLVHNAGEVLAAPVENMPLSGVREVFEVNFFGIYSLSQKLIPRLIRDGGRIIINASLAGRVGLPFFSPYVASKFAVEGFADCLRRELRPHGVRTVVLDTGAVATPIWDGSWTRIKSELLPAVGDRYRGAFERAAESFVRGGNAGMAAERAAGRILRIMEKGNPRSRYFLSDHPLLDRLEATIPGPIMDRLIAKRFGTA